MGSTSTRSWHIPAWIERCRWKYEWADGKDRLKLKNGSRIVDRAAGAILLTAPFDGKDERGQGHCGRRRRLPASSYAFDICGNPGAARREGCTEDAMRPGRREPSGRMRRRRKQTKGLSAQDAHPATGARPGARRGQRQRAPDARPKRAKHRRCIMPSRRNRHAHARSCSAGALCPRLGHHGGPSLCRPLA